jgi:hypothetical protein
VIASIWKARRTRAKLSDVEERRGKSPMKFNWLMVLPFVLFLGIAGIWLWQLQNNQFALQQGVDTPRCARPSRATPPPT